MAFPPKIKLLILADTHSSHMIKWVNSLAEKDFDILLVGLKESRTDEYKNIKIEWINTIGQTTLKNEGSITKLIYFTALPKIKKIIKQFKPDILHAHYATSYGLLGALSGFHPFIISAWGTDIISFPSRSYLHRRLLEFNLGKADTILATSKYLAEETSRYTNKNIEVTPFGIDLQKFKPATVNSIFSEGEIVIGTVKSMLDTYGIDYLIKAFKILTEKNRNQKLKLLMVGDGPMLGYYKKLTKELKIENDVVFTGKVPYSEIVKYHNMMDIEVYVSLYESFGVAVIEASACEKPVIVSNIGGLKEVVDNNVTGLFVEPKSIEQTAAAIDTLIKNEDLRKTLGRNGRKKVTEEYNWDNNLEKMISIYRKVINDRKAD